MTRQHVVLCRYGEIFLKKGNRIFFERVLIEQLRRVAAPFGATVERQHGRVLLWPSAKAENGDDPAALLAAVTRVFGLTSVSPAQVCPRELDAMCQAAIREVSAALAERGGARPTFKVEARRADKRFALTSPEIERTVGAAVLQATGLRVDVHAPELWVGVELGFHHAYVYARKLAGPGGLPVGTTGKADLLLSGGIDSPVAGYLAMKRGCHLAATYFHSFPYTGDRTKDKVRRLASHLAAWQGEIELRVVPFTAAQRAMRDAGDPALAVVLYRRMMMRVASRLAQLRGATALVTGEALAQVASQTMENLAVIEDAAQLLVLRPLLAHDKLETIELAKRIGTFDISIEPYEDACSMFVPKHPAIRARLSDVERVEAQVEVSALVEECVMGTERYSVQ